MDLNKASTGGNGFITYHSCQQCGYKTMKRRNLAAHSLRGCHQLVQKPHSCSSCSFRASTRAGLRSHQSFHLRKTPHQCSLCSYCANSISHLSRHLNRDHGSQRKGSSKKSFKFRCPHCPYRGTTPESLRYHKERHEIKSAFQCDLCTYSSVKISCLSLHFNRDHRNVPPPSQPAPPAKVKVEQPERLRTYHCGLCGYCSYASAGLAKHELAHQVRSAHQCRLCSFSAKSASRLERHVLRDHPRKKSGTVWRIPHDSVERPFHCSQCDYRASKAPELRNHLVKHQRRAAHQCQLCNYSANLMSHITFHQIRHHNPRTIDIPHPSVSSAIAGVPSGSHSDRRRSKPGPRKKKERTFGCNHCGFRTTTSSNLRIHMRNHVKKMAKQCPLCSYSGCKSSMALHLLRDHRNASDQAPAESAERDLEVNCEEEDNILGKTNRVPGDGRRTRKNKKKKRRRSDSRPYEICSVCDFTTNRRNNMRAHRLMHSWNERFRCPRCSYSSKVQQAIDTHLQRHHHTSDGPKEKDKSVSQRAEVMRGKVRLLQDELGRLSARRKEIQRRKEEALVWKTGTEAAVRALQSEVDRLRQLLGKESPDLTEEATTKELRDAEKKVQLSMADLQERADEVEGLEKELVEVEEELTSAQESLVGAEQVLSILEREMELSDPLSCPVVE